MNEYIEKMLTRHAIRRFQDKQLDDEILEQILNAGLYAPSAGNGQSVKIVVCQDKETNLEFGKISRNKQFPNGEPKLGDRHVSDDQPSILDDPDIKDGFYGAPTVLTLFTYGKGNHSIANVAFVAANIWHAANFLDVGCCYVGRTAEALDTEFGRELLKKWNIDEDMVPVANVLLGYIDGPRPAAKPRKEGRIIRV